MAEKDQGGVKSANRALDIIELVIARGQPLVAQDIATGLGIPLSSLSYLLSTLSARGYLVRDGRRYLPGPGLERLQLRERRFSLADRAAPLVRTLRTQLNETSSFFVRHGWQLEALVTETSEQALRYAVPTGAHNGLHGFAAGKAILAALPPTELDRYFQESERLPFTDHTVTDEPTLRAQLAEIRKTGVAVTTGEYDHGIIGIGRAAVVGDEVVGAFSVAFPATRDSDALRARIRDLLTRVVQLLESS